MNVYEPCSFSKFAKADGTGVHGETSARVSLVAGVLLEVDDHLLGEPGLAHRLSMKRLRGNVNFGKWQPLEAGRSIILRWSSCHASGHDKIYQRKTEGRPTPKRAMSRQERTSHRREHSALRVVAGSLSLIGPQCRPDSTKCRPYRLCVRRCH